MSDITHEADPSSPGGSASPGAGVSSRRLVEQLDEAACLELLSTGRIGRLIYNSRYGPVALPSEYTMHDGSIVFRTYRVTFTEEDLRTGIAQAEYQVVVEVDQVDPQAERCELGGEPPSRRPVPVLGVSLTAGHERAARRTGANRNVGGSVTRHRAKARADPLAER